MKFFIMLVFLSGFAYNYHQNKLNRFFVKKEPVLLGILGAYGLFAFYLAYWFDKSLMGYLVALSSVIFIYSFIFFQGISEKAVLIFLGVSPLLKAVNLEDVKDISIENIKNKNKFKVSFTVFDSKFSQVYGMSNKNEILNIFNGYI